MGSETRQIVFRDVSKFYGEVLGVNHVSLTVLPGITSLVGPNGAGKTTLLNLMTGLLRPTRGTLDVLGISSERPDLLFRQIGYCTQFDAFPRGLTGFRFLFSYLRVHGCSAAEAEDRSWRALEQAGLADAAHRKIGAYSKGMRQRIKLAQAICHDPSVVILDEPLNGLDPMARAEMLALFQKWAAEGRHVIVSSHILHEVEKISDRVILVNGGYVVAEGDIHSMRSEVPEHPIQVLIRCNRPALLASRLFQMDHIVEVKLQEDHKGLLIRTLDADSFYLNLNDAVLENDLEIEMVTPSDEDIQSVYQYLIDSNGGTAR